jgi:hypothetical protein
MLKLIDVISFILVALATGARGLFILCVPMM